MFGERGGSLYRELELADIAGPPPEAQDALALRMQRFLLLLREILRQRHEVLGPLRQRREVQHKTRDALKQVVSKQAREHSVFDIVLHRGNQPEPNAVRMLGAERPYLSGFQNAQEFDLALQRELMKLIQKQRATVGDADEPPSVNRTGVRSATRSEQQTLDQPFRKRPDVEVHHRAAAATPNVDVLRKNFFAGAGLPNEQHGRGGCGNATGKIDEGSQLWRYADDRWDGRPRVHRFRPGRSLAPKR